ncbi:MAG: DUF4838 domain-containing protein [Lentisphaeria bacterium]|nr:DUF4838 domain-containing protein [Lentisphaeria bacterium]
MGKILFLAGMLFLFSLPAAGEITVKPEEIVIVLEEGSGNREAAKELKLHLEKITSRKIPLLRQGEKLPAGKRFPMYVGLVPGNGKETFSVHEAHYLIREKEAFFYGHEEGGSRFAVYEFLESALNVRWPSGDDIYAPRQEILVIGKTQGNWKPPFTLRFMRSGKKQVLQRIWKNRMRMAWAREWQYGSGDAEYGNWWKLYGKSHPEFFAMNIRGFRGPAPTRLKGLPLTGDADAYKGKELRVAFCCSSPSYLEEVAKRYEEKKAPAWLNFSQPDVYAFECCYCEKCLALDPFRIKKGERLPDYGLADRYIHMTNALGDKVLAKHPQAKIMSEIYNFSRNPPARARIKYPGNTFYRMVPGDFTMKGIDSLLEGWKKAGMKKFFYRPNRHGHYITLMPCGYEEYFFDILQKLVKAGCLGFDYDVAHTYLHSGQYFSDYVLFKAMQDPSKDFAHWEQHYMQAFSPAQEEISAYYAYWRNEVWKKRLEKDVGKLEKAGKFYNFGRGLAWNLGKYYRKSDFSEAEKPLKKALARTDLPDDVRKRIEKLLLENFHSFLIFRAMTGKKDADRLALLRFREKHSFPLFPDAETKWGDLCGLKKLQQLKEYLPPYLETPLFWYFKLDPENVGMKEKWYWDPPEKFRKWGAVMATNSNWENPHKHYKNISSAIREKTARYDGIAWYAVTLPKIPEEWKGRRIFLYFGAVDESCTVFINGKKAGERIYKKPTDWHTPFVMEISSCIDWEKETQSAVIRVEDAGGAGGIWKRVTLVSKEK